MACGHVSMYRLVLPQNLCFTKKIRYESRKPLAQARPRIKGRFVRVLAEPAAGSGSSQDAAPSKGPGGVEIAETCATAMATPSNGAAAVDIMAEAEVTPALNLIKQDALFYCTVLQRMQKRCLHIRDPLSNRSFCGR